VSIVIEIIIITRKFIESSIAFFPLGKKMPRKQLAVSAGFFVHFKKEEKKVI